MDIDLKHKIDSLRLTVWRDLSYKLYSAHIQVKQCKPIRTIDIDRLLKETRTGKLNG